MTKINQLTSKSNEWYTPPDITDKARLTMGTINLDPSSNPFSNQWIKADYYYTIFNNGLIQPWFGNIWLNPPYGRQTKKWLDRAIFFYKFKIIHQGCILITCAPERGWFKLLWEFPLLFFNKRIR